MSLHCGTQLNQKGQFIYNQSSFIKINYFEVEEPSKFAEVCPLMCWMIGLNWQYIDIEDTPNID